MASSQEILQAQAEARVKSAVAEFYTHLQRQGRPLEHFSPEAQKAMVEYELGLMQQL